MSDGMDQYILAAQRLKESLVRDEGIGADLVPMLTLITDQTPSSLIQLGGPHLETAAMWAVVAFQPEEVISTCEAYIDPVNLCRADNLMEAFPTDSSVWEVLMVSHSVPGQARGCILPYRYDGRTVEWRCDICSNGDAPVFSPLARGIEAGFRSRIDPVDALLELQHQDAVVDLIDPRCPCGSGTAFVDCCLPSTN